MHHHPGFVEAARIDEAMSSVTVASEMPMTSDSKNDYLHNKPERSQSTERTFNAAGTQANDEVNPSPHRRVSDVDTDRLNIGTDEVLRAVDVTQSSASRHHPKRMESPQRSKPRVIHESNQEEQYSYTDPAGMYRDTEPRWRPRRSAVAIHSQVDHQRSIDYQMTVKTQRPQSDFQPENLRDTEEMPHPEPRRPQSDFRPVSVRLASNPPRQHDEITSEPRVRIVERPKNDNRQPKSILRKPTSRFPVNPNPIQERVAPLSDATKKGIPPGARWTKIDRRLVNPEALEEAKERFEERLDCLIVLRVLDRDEIQKLADRTKEIRDERYANERFARREEGLWNSDDEEVD